MQAVNLAGTLARIADFWSPTIVGQVNDFHVKLVKLKGECLIVPHRTEHRPVADEEVHVLLLEPASTVNTGSAGGGPGTPSGHRSGRSAAPPSTWRDGC